MLKKSISDSLYGFLAIIMGLFVIILALLTKNGALLIFATLLINTGFLLFALSAIGLAKHEKIIAKYFLKKHSGKELVETISNAVLLCGMDEYSEWWKSQKEQNLASDHVSFGIFTVILGGVAEKEDMIKYGEHLKTCPICQHYSKSWDVLISQKIKEWKKAQNQSDPFY